MLNDGSIQGIHDHFEFLKNAFDSDGFNIKYFDDPEHPGQKRGYVEYMGKIGMLGESRDSTNIVTGEPKRVYYVEGDPYQMGYLLGLMAEPEISRMATDFVENIIFAFFKGDEAAEKGTPGIGELIKETIAEIIYLISKQMQPDIPADYIKELCGIYSGCVTVNPATKVQWDRLWALNFGVDCLLAHIYTGKIFADKEVPPQFLKVPISCNAYSLTGATVQDNSHYFGRDFMFPTADVFQDTACLIIYNPDQTGGTALPLVSQTAPGFVGSIAALNSEGVAIGVDMSPSQLCDPSRPGLNSLTLNRDCMHHCRSTGEVKERMIETQRGVSWLYPTAAAADGACIIEAGKKIDDNSFPYFDYVPDHYKKYLPDMTFIEETRKQYGTPPPEKGLIVRTSAYPFPDPYLGYNQGLYDAFNQDLELRLFYGSVKYDPDAFGETGFINPTWTDKNCPASFYFAPQRETDSDLVLVSNHCISPEMRLTAMNRWVAIISSGDLNDIQWRYDALNFQILTLIKEIKEGKRGKIEAADAWKLIDYLSPQPGSYYPDYYNPGQQKDWKTIQVNGSISLCELKTLTMTSLFGYYGDNPITIKLAKYLGDNS